MRVSEHLLLLEAGGERGQPPPGGRGQRCRSSSHRCRMETGSLLYGVKALVPGKVRVLLLGMLVGGDRGRQPLLLLFQRSRQIFTSERPPVSSTGRVLISSGSVASHPFLQHRKQTVGALASERLEIFMNCKMKINFYPLT